MKVNLCICFSLLTIFSNVALINAESRITKEERDSLISIFLSTKGDEWNVNKGWKENPLELDGFSKSGTECDWYGVTCDDNKESVIAIELCANNLSGNLPDKINKFKKLKRLNLWVNQISGKIPDDIGELKSLELLCLGSNNFSGTIPTKIGNLNNLKYLYIDTNSLTGKIPQEICFLSKLEILSLHSNNLNGIIPKGISRLVNLRELVLFQNDLSGMIPKEIGALARLEQLNIHSNRLTGPIPIEIITLSNLKENKSNFCGNMLFTDDAVTIEFLNKKQYGIFWEKCQKIRQK